MAIPELGDERVIVVGAGIAGPILALLLHKKGYRPVIVEKVTKLGEAGGSIYLQPNGYEGFLTAQRFPARCCEC